MRWSFFQRVSPRSVTLAIASADAALARYKGGVGSLLDLITAQLDDTNAKVQRIQSYLDWYQALARLNFALGASDKKAGGKRYAYPAVVLEHIDSDAGAPRG